MASEKKDVVQKMYDFAKSPKTASCSSGHVLCSTEKGGNCEQRTIWDLQDMTGCESLDEVGTWLQNSEIPDFCDGDELFEVF